MDLLAWLVRRDEVGSIPCIAFVDRQDRRSRIIVGVVPPFERQSISVGIGRFSSQVHRVAGAYHTCQLARYLDDRVMVGGFEVLDAPVGSGREIVLDGCDPMPLRLEVDDQFRVVWNLTFQSLASPG